ncbi:hypothetical protein D9M70_604910 [compost metagenome]
MGKFGQHLAGGFGGADIHAPVDQRGIHADQLTGQHARQVQRQVGLAGGSGAHEKDGGRQGRHRKLV